MTATQAASIDPQLQCVICGLPGEILSWCCGRTLCEEHQTLHRHGHLTGSFTTTEGVDRSIPLVDPAPLPSSKPVQIRGEGEEDPRQVPSLDNVTGATVEEAGACVSKALESGSVLSGPVFRDSSEVSTSRDNVAMTDRSLMRYICETCYRKKSASAAYFEGDRLAAYEWLARHPKHQLTPID